MSSLHTGRMTRWAAACAAVLLPLSVAACGAGEGNDEGTAPERESEVDEVPDGDMYFEDGREFVGDTVAVSGEVTEVLSPTAFELDGSEWGDRSVLVLPAEEVNVTEDEVVEVTGVLRRFAYDTYFDEYGLTGPVPYEPYEGENFVEAAGVEQNTAPATSAAGT